MINALQICFHPKSVLSPFGSQFMCIVFLMLQLSAVAHHCSEIPTLAFLPGHRHWLSRGWNFGYRPQVREEGHRMCHCIWSLRPDPASGLRGRCLLKPHDHATGLFPSHLLEPHCYAWQFLSAHPVPLAGSSCSEVEINTLLVGQCHNGWVTDDTWYI